MMQVTADRQGRKLNSYSTFIIICKSWGRQKLNSYSTLLLFVNPEAGNKQTRRIVHFFNSVPILGKESTGTWDANTGGEYLPGEDVGSDYYW